MTFRYTDEEVDHLQGLCLYIFMGGDVGQYDVEYLRDEAEMLRNDPTMYCNTDYPDENDPFGPTVDDLLESADRIECGFVGGEELP